MFKKFLSAKIHRATITHADLHYEGGITLPPALLETSGISEYEAVNIWNVTRGTRFETYAIKGNSEFDVCVNGAAAHLVEVGDIIIIATFDYFLAQDLEKKDFHPRVVFVDDNNQIKFLDKEVAGPQLRRKALA